LSLLRSIADGRNGLAFKLGRFPEPSGGVGTSIASLKISLALVAPSRSKNCNAPRKSKQLGTTLELASLQQALEFLDGLLRRDSVHQSYLPAEAVERRHV
jgi:hypothetical protein